MIKITFVIKFIMHVAFGLKWFFLTSFVSLLRRMFYLIKEFTSITPNSLYFDIRKRWNLCWKTLKVNDAVILETVSEAFFNCRRVVKSNLQQYHERLKTDMNTKLETSFFYSSICYDDRYYFLFDSLEKAFVGIDLRRYKKSDCIL